MCPAAAGKIRCPLRPESMARDQQRPEILTPPEQPPACCAQQTITVPAAVTAKTAQKHDYPSAAHRRSCNRRSSAERTFSTVKDPATSNIARGWCRLTGLTPSTLFTACLLIIRNQRILDAFAARQELDARRAEAGLPPKTRRRHEPPASHVGLYIGDGLIVQAPETGEDVQLSTLSSWTSQIVAMRRIV
jgi:hypothetical protein